MSVLTPAQAAQLANFSEVLRAILPNEEAVRLAGPDHSNAGGLAYDEVNLAQLSAGGYSKVDSSGYMLQMLERDSAKGALLMLQMGSEMRAFGPGDTFYGRFSQYNLKLHPDSVTTGTVRFVRTLTPWANFLAGPGAHDNVIAQPLLGTGTALTQMVQLAAGTRPTTLANSFDVTGWKKIRVRTVGDDGAAGTLGTNGFSLLPWLNTARVTGAANWFAQNDQVVVDPGIPDGGAGYNLRSLVIPVTGRGLMYLEPFGLTGMVGLPLFVEGIE